MTGGVVLVIGPTGRNFAAGMSGGIAYVLDETGEFSRSCNTEMVELLSISDDMVDGVDEAAIHSDPLRFDSARIRMMLQKHVQHTNSTHAQVILDNWPLHRGKFVKIMPRDYRRAILDLQAEATSGKGRAQPNLRVVG